jgi:spermidine synthase
MSARFAELAHRETPIGTVSLRRRWDPVAKAEVHEVKLDDEYLMSSLFTAAEIELARLGLAGTPGEELDVVVGGLGLGHTAATALEDQRVRELFVVEALDAVIEWHREHLVPLGAELTSDPRTRVVHGDFFAMARDGFDPGRLFHAVLLDIDHSPHHVLDPGHADFYGTDGLRRIADQLRPGGVFALWSDDPPDQDFHTALTEVFATAQAHVVTFANPYGGESSNTVYVAARG